MTLCKHKRLTLVGKTGKKLRCGHCHLTINEEELEIDFCPECWEAGKIRRWDFEEIIEKENDTYQYRCEKCGVLIRVGE